MNNVLPGVDGKFIIDMIVIAILGIGPVITLKRGMKEFNEIPQAMRFRFLLREKLLWAVSGLIVSLIALTVLLLDFSISQVLIQLGHAAHESVLLAIILAIDIMLHVVNAVLMVAHIVRQNALTKYGYR